MKKYLLCMAISFVLVACGVNEENGYKATAELEIEGKISVANLTFDEKGDILYWGEQDVEFGDDERTKIWTGDDIRELDIKIWDQWSVLTNSGKLVNKRVDDTGEDHEYMLMEYDPITDEAKESSKEKQQEEIEIKENVQEAINLTERDREPIVYLSEDASEAWVVIKEDGIYHYDMETEETKALLLNENMYRVYPGLTADENYFIYGVYAANDNDEYQSELSFHALDLNTLDTKELDGVEGRAVGLSNGNIAYVQDNMTITEVDVASGKEKTLYEIKINEGYELDLATISPDKSTIAYSYRKSKGDDGVIQVLKKEDGS